MKGNPYHDARGRFTSPGTNVVANMKARAAYSYDPKEREKNGFNTDDTRKVNIIGKLLAEKDNVKRGRWQVQKTDNGFQGYCGDEKAFHCVNGCIEYDDEKYSDYTEKIAKQSGLKFGRHEILESNDPKFLVNKCIDEHGLNLISSEEDEHFMEVVTLDDLPERERDKLYKRKMEEDVDLDVLEEEGLEVTTYDADDYYGVSGQFGGSSGATVRDCDDEAYEAARIEHLQNEWDEYSDMTLKEIDEECDFDVIETLY